MSTKGSLDGHSDPPTGGMGLRETDAIRTPVSGSGATGSGSTARTLPSGTGWYGSLRSYGNTSVRQRAEEHHRSSNRSHSYIRSLSSSYSFIYRLYCKVVGD
uniref:Uncharacterized protein n=1 Tax=Amphimedon queenslandica TaxID=400682 RepID=A0A1X7USX5_AMPQE